MSSGSPVDGTPVDGTPVDGTPVDGGRVEGGRVTTSSPLRGRRIVTTREWPGQLDAALAAAGAEVVHVPLIAVGPPPDGGAALGSTLAHLDRYEWVIVTSRHGASLVGAAVAATAVRTAAVGAATAAVLADLSGRPVDLVPAIQRADALVDAFIARIDACGPVLVAQAELAEPTLVEGLRAAGHQVDAVTAYSTHSRKPDLDEISSVRSADAVLFASGSAARAWVEGVGTWTPPVVCAIGPTTADAAAAAGLEVTAVATDHSVPGLVALVVDVLGPRS